MPSSPAGRDLLALAVDIAAAAAQVLSRRPDDLGVDAKTTPTDAVTVVDRAAERVILDALAAARPDDAVVSEEGSGRPGSSGVTWYVDPLDGTVNYLYGLPHYAVSIAAAVGDELVCGVVRNGATGETFTATRGEGAWRDGTRIHCGQQADPALSLVATGFGYEAERRSAQARTLTLILPMVRDIRRAGSAALDLCSVACGQVDAFFEAGMHPWDWSAGAVIAREAGARVDGLQDKPPGGHTTLAANPVLFGALHDLLVAAEADDASLEASGVVEYTAGDEPPGGADGRYAEQ